MIDFFPGKLTGIFSPRENSSLTLKRLVWLPTTQLLKVYSNTSCKIYFIYIWMILFMGPLPFYMILVVVQILKYFTKFSKKNLGVQFHWHSYGCLKYNGSSNNVISFNIVSLLDWWELNSKNLPMMWGLTIYFTHVNFHIPPTPFIFNVSLCSSLKGSQRTFMYSFIFLLWFFLNGLLF